MNLLLRPFDRSNPRLLRHRPAADPQRRLFAAVLASLDEAVGTVSKAITDARIADNTVVVFLGDNGCGGSASGCRNTPLRGWKYSYYEGGSRIPFMMSWPGALSRVGTKYTKPVISFDLFTTFVKAAGGDVPSGVDGVDLLPYLQTGVGTPHQYLFWGTRSAGAVRKGKWKLVGNALFNLDKDVKEKTNVAATNPTVVADLQNKRNTWLATLGAPLW